MIKISIQKDIQTFCQNVHKYRTKMGLSLSELSRHSGVALEMLEALEQGEIPEEMMVDDAIDLARVFGCEPYELFQ